MLGQAPMRQAAATTGGPGRPTAATTSSACRRSEQDTDRRQESFRRADVVVSAADPFRLENDRGVQAIADACHPEACRCGLLRLSVDLVTANRVQPLCDRRNDLHEAATFVSASRIVQDAVDG